MTLSRPVMLCCAALLASACTTPASRTAAAPEPASATPVAAAGESAGATAVADSGNEDPLICERVTRTGTRISERICMRQSEIEKRQRDASEMLGEVQRRSAMQPNREPQ